MTGGGRGDCLCLFFYYSWYRIPRILIINNILLPYMKKGTFVVNYSGMGDVGRRAKVAELRVIVFMFEFGRGLGMKDSKEGVARENNWLVVCIGCDIYTLECYVNDVSSMSSTLIFTKLSLHR